MTFSFIGAHVLRISDYVLIRSTMIYNWAKASGLCINPSKSKCLLLSRTKRAFVVPDIIIRGNKINFVESANMF